MKHLVISVSPDSSLELMAQFADVLLLDDGTIPTITTAYDTVYIRSHFGSPSTLPQNYRTEIDAIVSRAKLLNSKVRYIDATNTVDSIVEFEDKWHQYQRFRELMPYTELLSDTTDLSHFTRPFYKRRLSSRGLGVTWDANEVTGSFDEWIVQETLDIKEELRIFVIYGEVYTTGAIRQHKTDDQAPEIMNTRELSQDEIDFAQKVVSFAPSLDIVGLDVARTTDGTLQLMEANRSPGFAKFHALTGVNLARNLYVR